ncbi:hypothetical protein N7457_006332 [Penicillium paradoxum]|uniref:uncharacterized protein n=1 Tax=Penicillium paradoxum TaxID=176176 RepID=UPI0025485D42|nr:uncharacterized protein N7457_006332 [Penicillium paradoxum]KAJ5781172.1 hypothetical protein N7457_006332 [Penicillium paradoxum]
MDNYSASPSNVFRPRRSDDWHEYREIIEQLYRNDQLKLRDVKRIMERDYKFFASYYYPLFPFFFSVVICPILGPRYRSSPPPFWQYPLTSESREKQYKDRLAAWHVRKNIKAKEVHLMLRKQQKRAAQGKQTAFRVNGQNVDPKRIARFVRRYGTSWDSNRGKEPEAEPQSPEPQTPSDMTCYTPEPTDEHSTTPISPLPDMQSPTREMPPFPLGSYGKSTVVPVSVRIPNDIDGRCPALDPNHIENLPDLELDEGPGMPLAMHSQPRHPHSYHHSIGNHLSHGAHNAHNAHGTHAVAHPHGAHNAHNVHNVHNAHNALNAHNAHNAHTHAHGQPGPAPRDLEDAPGEDDTHPSDWNTVESFQTRLQDLDYTLTQSMSKWASQQDPNSEIQGNHEGLGM